MVEVLILSKNNQITGFLGLGEILHYIFFVRNLTHSQYETIQNKEINLYQYRF